MEITNATKSVAPVKTEKEIQPVLNPLDGEVIQQKVNVVYTTTKPTFAPKFNGVRRIYFDGTDYWYYVYAKGGWRSTKLDSAGFPDSPAQGDVLYYNGTVWSRLAAGTSGQVLTTNGASANPSWGSGIPSGAIMPYGGSSAPSGFLLCDGSAVSRTTYAALFTAISTNFGSGDGSTTFNVPDLRANVPAGFKSGDANFGTLGGATGEATHVLTIAEMPAHTHNVQFYANGAVNKPSESNGSNTTDQNPATSSTGGGGAHNNIQPSLTVNYIIKT